MPGAIDRSATRTVVRARYPEDGDYFVVETILSGDDAAHALEHWQALNDREGNWTDLHLATETITVTYTRVTDAAEAEHAAQWADVEAGEAHLRDTDPERTHS